MAAARLGIHAKSLPFHKRGAVMVLPPQAWRLRADQAETVPDPSPPEPVLRRGPRESADGHSEATSVVNAHVPGATARGRPTPTVYVCCMLSLELARCQARVDVARATSIAPCVAPDVHDKAVCAGSELVHATVRTRWTGA